MKTRQTHNTARKAALLLGLSGLLLPALARAQGGAIGTGASGIPQNVDPNSSAKASDEETKLLSQVGFDQNLDAPIPLNLTFHDEKGEQVRLKQYFGQKPVVLVMIYYQCKTLCSPLIGSTVAALKEVPETAGKDYEFVVVSIDPNETPKMAASNQAEYAAQYERTGAQNGFHFLTGTDANIKPLAQALGVRYVYDPKSGEYLHPGGFVMATPDGHVSRYFQMLDRSGTRDLHFGFIESSQGKIGSPIEKILLTCYHYDPKTGTYSASITSVIRLVAVLLVLSMATGIGISILLEKRAAKAEKTSTPKTPSIAKPA